MTLAPSARRFVIVCHVLASAGWAGAVAVFLVLAIAGLSDGEPLTLRAVYVAMDLATAWIIVPLSFAAPLTGLVLGLGTRWGLFRHYWVAIKLVMTLPSTGFLLMHTGPIGAAASFSAGGSLPQEAAALRLQLVVDAGAALAVLVVATCLAVYKPAGVTPFRMKD
ncbi:MAG: hypothetical protein Q8R02_02985 [Hyphomonadaceae bacterium]|nr:hypothetical protein [Hyphomonadaceae bacterium]